MLGKGRIMLEGWSEMSIANKFCALAGKAVQSEALAFALARNTFISLQCDRTGRV